MEFGISTFGEVHPEGVSGGATGSYRRMQELLAEAQLADRIGLDVFAIGEHHRPDFIVSAPEVVLAGIATTTQRIRLSTSVTVLSSADPVRTFQNFASLDLLSGGRAEIMAGRGSFIESFPLFGYDLNDYHELFVEKLELLLRINDSEHVSWDGQFRAGIAGLGVYPRPLQDKLPIWIAVGGTPQSAVRAGKLNLPMTIAILGGKPSQFLPFVELYRESAKDAGHDPLKLPLGINSQFYLADSSDQAADEFWPTYEKLMNRIGKERGWSPITRDHFEQLRTPEGPLVVGTVEEAVNKMLYQKRLFNHTRFLGQLVKGDVPQEKILHSIGLFGEMADRVREELNKAEKE